jgi:hypothetical protein
MRQLTLTFVFFFSTPILYAQKVDFEFKFMKFQGIEFVTSETDIIKSFGKAAKAKTDYECGRFSIENPKGPFYQLKYAGFNYIGSAKGKFFLENVEFDKEGRLKIAYKDKKVSGKTSRAEFAEMFNENTIEEFDKNSLIIYSKGFDDGAKFTFKNGLLVAFEYWTLC